MIIYNMFFWFITLNFFFLILMVDWEYVVVKMRTVYWVASRSVSVCEINTPGGFEQWTAKPARYLKHVKLNKYLDNKAMYISFRDDPFYFIKLQYCNFTQEHLNLLLSISRVYLGEEFEHTFKCEKKSNKKIWLY